MILYFLGSLCCEVCVAAILTLLVVTDNQTVGSHCSVKQFLKGAPNHCVSSHLSGTLWLFMNIALLLAIASTWQVCEWSVSQVMSSNLAITIISTQQIKSVELAAFDPSDKPGRLQIHQACCAPTSLR